jgi:predicted nucleic-acid-binding protein
MNITVDTNVLVRALVGDEPAQSAAAIQVLLEAGGDFVDAVIAHQGQWLGGEMFVSFDRQAVALLTAEGVAARLLALE